MSFVVFSDDWGGHPSSCQHIFRAVCRERPVLWVNTVGLRLPRPTLADARKALRKLGRMVWGGGGRAKEGLGASPAVVSPLMTPFDRPRWLRELSTRSVTKAVARGLASLGGCDPVVVTTVPNAHEAIARLDARRVVYYCVDDFSEWPGMDKARILAMEEALLESVDVVVATSRALYERFQERLPTHLLTHGVDLEAFSRKPAAEHEALRGIPEPRVGYYGLLDGRTDEPLLAEVARRLPGVSFVITGPVEGEFPELRRLGNVRFTGPVTYEELPAVTLGWKACILPYKVNALTEKINPLKLKEYIAAGRPVLATPLPEACMLEPHVRVAGTVEAWECAVRAAVDGRWLPDDPAARCFLEPHSWERKAAEFLRICEESSCEVAAT